MPIGTPTSIGSANDFGSATSLVITTTATATVSSRITVEACGTETITGVVDSAGNTYALDRQHANGACRITIASAPVTTQLGSGGTITVSYAAGSFANMAAAQTTTGIATSSAVDQANSNTQFSAATWDSGNVNTTTADDLLIGCSAVFGTATTSTAGGGATELFDAQSGGNSFTSVYRILSATGTFNATGTWASVAGAPDQSSAVVTYKMAAAPPPAVNIAWIVA